MNTAEQFRECGCCKRVVDTRTNEWDGIYGCCSKCAWCSSLEHFEPCHHGECMKEDGE